MFSPATRIARPVLRPALRFVPALSLPGLLAAVIEADRRYREARKLARLDYPYLRDMGLDLGRTRAAR